MPQWPNTRATLLTKLQEADDQSTWDEFLRLYRPAIYRFARRQGLQDADADDVTQRVLESVSRSIATQPPDPERGRFRSWVATVTRNAVINLVNRDHKHRGSGKSSVVEMLHAQPENSTSLEQQWLHEERIQYFRAAAEEVRVNCTPAVWQAFERTTLEGSNIEAVARELGVSVGVVYASRSRVMKRIRRIVEQLADE